MVAGEKEGALGDDDLRNIDTRASRNLRSNQTGELTAVLLVVKNLQPSGNLKILSDSLYMINGLTTNRKKWEEMHCDLDETGQGPQWR